MSEYTSAPKTARKNILRFFVCLLIAFLLWFYVMYTENPEYDQKYTDIRVELRGYTPSYEFDINYPETIDATFRGTNVDLAQCNSEDIVAVINFPAEFTSGGVRSVTISFEFLNDVSLTPLKEVRTTLFLTEADMQEYVFKNVPVKVTGHTGSQIEHYDFSVLSVPELTVRGRAEDIEILKETGLTATASLSNYLINDIRDKVNDDQWHEFTVQVDIALPTEGMKCWTNMEDSAINTTVSVRNSENKQQTDAEESNSDLQLPTTARDS